MNTHFKISGLCLLAAVAIAACSSQSVMPDKSGIKVGREKPAKDCKELGKVTGSTVNVKGTREEVLEDMKQNAADKGATYVEVLQYSDSGTAVTGLAYQCN